MKAVFNLKAVACYCRARPEHKKYKLYGGIAGFSVSKQVAAKAKEHGLFVLKRAGMVLTRETQGMHAY